MRYLAAILKRSIHPNRLVRKNTRNISTVDTFLESLRAAGREPSLVDIERCRPDKHSHPHSQKYAEEYTSLVDNLCQSFTKMQLRHFAELYNLPMTRSTRKLQYAEKIVEKQWKWPSLKDIEREKRDMTEISSKCA
jgi:hypothetical protein